MTGARPRVVGLHVRFVLRNRGHDVAQETALAGRGVEAKVEEDQRDLLPVEEIEELGQMREVTAEARQLGNNYRRVRGALLDQLQQRRALSRALVAGVVDVGVD